MTNAAPAPGANALTRAEREAMLLSVQKLVKSLVRKSGCSRGDREDREQEMNLLVWQATERFDPSRGARFVTYAQAIVENALRKADTRDKNTPDRFTNSADDLHRVEQGGQPEPWEVAAEAEAGPEADHEGALSGAVRAQLAEGILDRLGDRSRALVEQVAIHGLTAAQIAEQTGHPIKVVRTNLKNAIKTLDRAGLVEHVATPAEIAAAVNPPDPRKAAMHKASQARKAEQAIRPRLLQLGRRCDYFELLGRVRDAKTRAAVERIRLSGHTVDEVAGYLGVDVADALRRIRSAVVTLSRGRPASEPATLSA